jgi:hypothetical protein
MLEDMGSRRRSFGRWRVVASAWVVTIVFVLLFAGAETLACRHGVSPHESSLAGAIIPRHDSAGYPGPDEIAASDWQERARAEAYSSW